MGANILSMEQVPVNNLLRRYPGYL